jgi:hypothetical protein
MANLRFEKTTIGVLSNDVGPAPMNTFLAVGDVDGDGREDVVLSGRDGAMAWFAQPRDTATASWTMHTIDPAITRLECGGVIADLTGSGCREIICGGDWRSDELAWWENPGSAAGPWIRRVIARTGANQFHDELLGRVTVDGKRSLVFGNQGDGSLYRVPTPPDPRVSPWPGIERIATGMRTAGLPEEGLVLADIDGDGRDEIIAGTHWYKHQDPGRWECHRFVDEALKYVTTVIAVGDIDGDGQLEIVLAEGDCCIYGRPEGGRVAVFRRPRSPADVREPWRETVLAEGLLDPHSVVLADLGRGVLDLVIGEIGVKEKYEQEPPRMMWFANDGRGNFSPPRIFDIGTGSHHARLIHIGDQRRPAIVSRPLHGPQRWELHLFTPTAAS